MLCPSPRLPVPPDPIPSAQASPAAANGRNREISATRHGPAPAALAPPWHRACDRCETGRFRRPGPACARGQASSRAASCASRARAASCQPVSGSAARPAKSAGPLTAQGPAMSRSARAWLCTRNREAQPQPRQPEELAEGAQQDHPVLCPAHARRRGGGHDIDKALIHDQQAHAVAQGQKLRWWQHAPIGVVGVDHHGQIGARKRVGGCTCSTAQPCAAKAPACSL